MIDLSHEINERMPVYPGDPVVELAEVTAVLDDGYANSVLRMGMHVGTHIDGPAHMVNNGERLCNIRVERFCGEAVLLDCRHLSLETVWEAFKEEKRSVDIVLVLTGHDVLWGRSEYFTDFKEIGVMVARDMVQWGVRMVGLDAPSPDKASYRVHEILLEGGVLIIENLTGLTALKGFKRFEIIALPLKIEADSAPVRVIAREIRTLEI